METRIFVRDDLQTPVQVPLSSGTAIAFTCRSPTRVDEPNEDAIGIYDLGPGARVLAVADGVGGHGAGDVGARTALECLAEALSEFETSLQAPLETALEAALEAALDRGEPGPADLREPVLTAIERANARLIALSPSPATTLVVATLSRRQLRCYTVGDSELMVVGQRGKLKLRTIPHSPVGYARESGLLDETSALLHDDRHLLSNVVGMEGMHVAATTGLTLAPRDTVVLGSDGVFDNLFHDEIIELIRAGDPMARSEEMIAALRKRMAGKDDTPETPSKPDDISFVLFRP